MANNFPNLRPTLNLDMVNGIYVDPRVTFTRAGTRTYYGQEMVKAEENLLLQSQALNEAAWTKGDSTITADAGAAPDGTTTADKLAETATNATHQASQLFSSSGVAAAFSIYVKAVERSFVKVVLRDAVLSGTVRADSVFDLTLGVVTSTVNGTATISDAGSGWYRCTVYGTPASGSRAAFVRVMSDSTTDSYAGAAGSGVLVWGAQVEERSSITAYTPTTTQPITRYQRQLKTAAANEWPREFDPVTGECLGRSVWESRTNLLQRSEEFDNAYWNKLRATVTANQIIAPDGTLSADKHIQETGQTTSGLVQRAVTTTGNHTFSVFAKKAEKDFIFLQTVSPTRTFFNLAAGTVGTTSASHTANITDAGNGWYWCSVTFSVGISADNVSYGLADTDGSTTVTDSGGIYIWGAQLETGAFATPYIPTVAAQVTRVADSAVMTGVNFSSWFNPEQGTLFVDHTLSSTTAFSSVMQLTRGAVGSAANFVQVYSQSGSYTMRNRVNSANTLELNIGANSLLPTKACMSYTSALVQSSSINGAAVSSSSTAARPTAFDVIEIGSYNTNHLNGYIKRLTYYNRSLASAELQAITR